MINQIEYRKYILINVLYFISIGIVCEINLKALKVRLTLRHLTFENFVPEILLYDSQAYFKYV